MIYWSLLNASDGKHTYESIGNLTLYQLRLVLTPKKRLGGIQQVDKEEVAAIKRRAAQQKERQKWPLPRAAH